MASTPLKETISDLRRQAGDTRQTSLWLVLNDIESAMGEGTSFALALQPWCPASDVLLLAAGGGGNRALAEAIVRVLKNQQGVSEMKTTLITVMLEPTLVLLGTYGMIIWMATSFLKALLSAARGIDTSQFTGAAHQLVLVGALGGGYKASIPPAIFVIISVVVFMSLPRWTGTIRKYADGFPPWSIYRAVQGAGWMQSFAMLAESKVPYEQIMKDTARLGTPWLRERVLAARHLMVRPGMPVGSALWQSGYKFPSKAVALNLQAFGARPGFGEALSEVSDEWFTTIVNSMKQASMIMGVVSMIVATLGILWLFQASNAMESQITTLLRARYGG